MNAKISSNISQLLGKMLGGETGEGTGEALSKQSMKGKAGKSKRGEALDNDLLLSGMGYSKADNSKGKKNKAEKQNVLRFLKDPKSELSQLMSRKRLRDSGKADQKKDKEPANQPSEAKEKQQVSQERIREERVQEGPAQALEHAEVKEMREPLEAKEPHHAHQEKKDQEEDGRGAGGWVLEDGDEDEDNKRKGGEAQVFSEAERCHGRLENGERCLRKAQEGSPFCRVHGV